MRVFGSKTGRERFLTLPEFTQECLQSYLLLRQNLLLQKGVQDEHNVLVNSRGKTINGERISLLLKPIAVRAGIERFHPVNKMLEACKTERSKVC